MPGHAQIEPSYCSSDVKRLATSLLTKADAVRDEDPWASVKRTHLLRASSHMLQAFAELQTLDGMRL